MKPFLDRVTICGADDSTQISDLKTLTSEFPFVEWGILVMKGRQRVGYPSYKKVVEFLEAGLPCAGHLCGDWASDINDGFWSIFASHPRYTEFQRFQINFAGKPIRPMVVAGIALTKLRQQIIFQVSDFEHLVFRLALATNLNVAAFYDLSHGNGKPVENWPKTPEIGYYGYAGGLNPENLARQLEAISQVAKVPSWIDVQTGVLTGNEFDIDKVRQFLTIAKEWVI